MIEAAVAHAKGDDEIVGVMLQGSVARGDAYPRSDLDLFMLLQAGCQRAFSSEVQEGILLECHYGNFEQAKIKIEKNPMLVYGFINGHILYDVDGSLRQLVALAQQCLADYQVSQEARKAISYWLQSARIKIIAAKEAGDFLKASYIASTTSWTVLEGLWAINNKPMPSAGTVLPHLGDLTYKPDNLHQLMEALFMGDGLARIDAIVEVIDWSTPLLSEKDEGRRL